ncbi:hypothetical protein JHK87_002921 [Glycine soja]|nr:hypothetical protein JHK87_002921 [Glycine soja]
MALEYLTLRKLPNLIRLSREGVQNMLPRLSNLEIGECPKFLAEEESLQGTLWPDGDGGVAHLAGLL